MEYAQRQPGPGSERNRLLPQAGLKDNRDLQQRIFRLSCSYSVQEHAGEVTDLRSDGTIDENPIQYRSSKADLEAGCVAMLFTVGPKSGVLNGDEEAEVRWAQWM